MMKSKAFHLKQSYSESSEYVGATLHLETSANLKRSHLESTEYIADKRETSTKLTRSAISDTTAYDEERVLNRNGYKMIRKICDTQQGELIEALSHQTNETVIIKKISNELHSKQIAKHDDDGMIYCTPKNIVKEALILGHLTAANQFTYNYITPLVNFFHCDHYFYLVLEHNDDTMNLKQFVHQSHHYLRAGKLDVKQYARVINFIFWQIFALIQWMHNDMHCCHLDLKLEHVILRNVEFVHEHHSVSIKPNISIQLCDFGSAEVFKNDNFNCDKKASPFAEIQYQSPKLVDQQIYDAQKADIFALGAMLFHCLVGRALYSNVCDIAYIAVMNGAFAEFVKAAHLRKYINRKMLDLLKNMLNVNENERYKILDVLKHHSFKIYYVKYKVKMEEKSKSQRSELIQQRDLKYFPYYKF